ncbi:MAG: hypothetical protein IPM84_14490 [Anaerolineae bacterium]|nr:hypothetical protein [Anaerolineae bacterium]
MSETSQSGLQLAETLGNRRLAAHFNVSLANVAYIRGAYAASRRQLAQSLAIYEEIADKESQALALHLLSRATLALGKATEAEKLSRGKPHPSPRDRKQGRDGGNPDDVRADRLRHRQDSGREGVLP